MVLVNCKRQGRFSTTVQDYTLTLTLIDRAGSALRPRTTPYVCSEGEGEGGVRPVLIGLKRFKSYLYGA